LSAFCSIACSFSLCSNKIVLKKSARIKINVHWLHLIIANCFVLRKKIGKQQQQPQLISGSLFDATA